MQRPGARELIYYMKPRCLSLVNSYNLGELTVKDVLIVVTNDNESLWIASTLKRGDVEEDVLSVYEILESESGPAFTMDVGYDVYYSQSVIYVIVWQSYACTQIIFTLSILY